MARRLGTGGVSRARPRSHAYGCALRRQVNSQSGMTETSLMPELAAHSGLTFEELVRWIVEDASLNR
ncbi:MAG TPA: hypothetical protein VII24_00500 [Pseudolabrys sp.]